MSRYFAPVAVFAFAALTAFAAPAAHAQLDFALTLDSGFFSDGGSGTIVLDTSPVNGDYTVFALNPHISFTLNGTTFTDADIYDPTNAVVRLSGDDTQRRFQFVETTGFSAFVFFDQIDSMGNNVEMSFDPDIYVVNEFARYNYSAIAAASTAVPEPGSVALLVGLTTVGTGFLRKRRSRS